MSTAAPARGRGAQHIPALDGLRGIAVLLVLWEHLPDSLTGPGLLAKAKLWIAPGFTGVDIFFVLSGFLITRILLADKARGMPLKNFLIRRFLRIFPIYYLLILVLLVVDAQPYLLYCAAYLGNFYWSYHPAHLPLHHTWSLAVEEHFYLFWPFVVYRLGRASARRFAVWGLIPFAFASGLLLWALDGKVPAWQLIYMSTFTRAGSLALGAAFAFHEDTLTADRRRALRAAGLLAAISVGAIALHLAVRGPGKILAQILFHGATSGLVVLGTLWLDARRLRAGRALAAGFLPFVGRISYGLYIYHYPIYCAFGLLDESPGAHPPASASLLGVVLTFAAAVASFYGIERSILRFKDRFREPVPVALPAAPAVEGGSS